MSILIQNFNHSISVCSLTLSLKPKLFRKSKFQLNKLAVYSLFVHGMYPGYRLLLTFGPPVKISTPLPPPSFGPPIGLLLGPPSYSNNITFATPTTAKDPSLLGSKFWFAVSPSFFCGLPLYFQQIGSTVWWNVVILVNRDWNVRAVHWYHIRRSNSPQKLIIWHKAMKYAFELE